jgi:transcriptional regulator with XRE-family HTH domain
VTTDREHAYVAAVGQRVRLLRVARRLSQDAFADLAGVSRVTLGSIERGEHAAGLLTYVKLADALGVGLSFLVDLDTDTDVLKLLGNPLKPTT